ncbi:transcription antitermination protein nusG [Alkalithermobacter thermoalcaliphilus JW-YL-7 = DSM 7308]|uniref:Transcription termination/antitermination protein NusG n=1 Tax=Alkalithermobacter thermoalcaliphilus JW-YL-7 = DSM 7308 TaxID=1121328 RepID=A0A150FN31_CLOPD|nr:NusG antitermination factor [[Clostridium] paradoxum JW-YL-7 = DSM 7308]SHL35338.1 transcription antitermination protein nusG [[Clostridium] paradoxum JW-YL-7 = DSM 7308]
MSELEKAKWYVVHTYSGHENKVKATIEKAVKTRGMEDYILELRVPTEDVVEIKNGKKKTRQRKIFPGYVLVKMIITDESWYVVRNTKGVTGFVGPGSKPIPLSDEEVKAMGVEEAIPEIDIEVGEVVTIKSGSFKGFMGTVQEINMEKQSLKVLISMFGRETPAEIPFDQVEKYS